MHPSKRKTKVKQKNQPLGHMSARNWTNTVWMNVTLLKDVLKVSHLFNALPITQATMAKWQNEQPKSLPNVSEHLKLRTLSYHCHIMIWNRPPLECILVHSGMRQHHPRSSGRPLSHHCSGFEVLGRSPNLLLMTQKTLFICQNVNVPQHKWKLICIYTARCKGAPREKWVIKIVAWFMLRLNSFHLRSPVAGLPKISLLAETFDIKYFLEVNPEILT